MFVDFDSVSDPVPLEADICIVGAGAAGITLALELIPTGKKILLLEGGDLRPKTQSQSLYEMDLAGHYESPSRSRLRYFGGSTNHWDGSVRTFSRIDFETRSWVANSGWPISFDDVYPYYSRAFVYVEAGPLADEKPYVNDYLGGLTAKLAKTGFECKVGYHSTPTHFGIQYADKLREAPNLTVVLNANLISINEAQNRRSVESLTVANYKGRKTEVKSRGNYVIALGGLENARALLLSDKVTPGGIGNEYGTVGRYFMDHPAIKAIVFHPSQEFVKSWRQGLLQFGGIDHALTLSASEEVLRQEHLVNARMPFDPVTEIDVSTGIESMHQIEKAVSKMMPLPHILSHLANIWKDEDLIVEQYRRKNGSAPTQSRGDKFGGYLFDMMMEQRPDPDNRITLTDKRDALGLRKGKVSWRLQQQEKDDFKRFVNLFAKRMGAQGLGIVQSLLDDDDTDRRFNELINWGSHHMGSTRMSATPKTGVVDGQQRIHGRENIYMAGSSVFPTGSHIPPTATIVATSIRLADHLRKDL